MGVSLDEAAKILKNISIEIDKYSSPEQPNDIPLPLNLNRRLKKFISDYDAEQNRLKMKIIKDKTPVWGVIRGNADRVDNE
jgi:hypothetical protein